MTSAGPREWVIVLRADLTIDAVSGDAPPNLVGTRVGLDAPLPDIVTVEARGLLRQENAKLIERAVVFAVIDDVETRVELLFAPGIPLRKTLTRTADLLLRTLDVFAGQASGANVDFTVEKAEDFPPALHVDGEKMAMVLATLVGNALRYAKERRKPGAHVHVAATWNREDDVVAIVVRDNGPGMPAARARWLFDRDPETGRAAGVALVVVRDVVVAHRGHIDVTSELGKGTTITVTIPRA